MPKRLNLKPAGKCVFCEGGAVPGNPMSREHLWSDWMTENGLLPRISREYTETAISSRRYTGEKKTFRRNREGSPSHKRLKVVCENCNTGWMSVLENEIQPFLTPLIKGDRCVLSPAAQAKLAEWVSLKILVAENSAYPGYPADPIYSQPVRTTFKDTRAIPFGMRIYIGKQEWSPIWITGYHRHASGLGDRVLLPPPRHPTGTKNVQSVTWGLGRLLIYVSAVSDPEIEKVFGLGRVDPLRQLYPFQGRDIIWPPFETVGGTFADDLSRALERYLAANMG